MFSTFTVLCLVYYTTTAAYGAPTDSTLFHESLVRSHGGQRVTSRGLLPGGPGGLGGLLDIGSLGGLAGGALGNPGNVVGEVSQVASGVAGAAGAVNAAEGVVDTVAQVAGGLPILGGLAHGL